MTNVLHDSPKTPIPLWLALIPLLFLVSMLAGSVALFASNSSYGPNQIALLLAAGVASLVGLYLGESWHEIESAMVDGITLALKACLILLAVGSLIGSWMLAGTAPTVIYFGLGILEPSWFYPGCDDHLCAGCRVDRQFLDDRRHRRPGPGRYCADHGPVGAGNGRGDNFRRLFRRQDVAAFGYHQPGAGHGRCRPVRAHPAHGLDDRAVIRDRADMFAVMGWNSETVQATRPRASKRRVTSCRQLHHRLADDSATGAAAGPGDAQGVRLADHRRRAHCRAAWWR